MRKESNGDGGKAKIMEDPKDEFITSSLTLRKLQKKKIIPSQIVPITLKTQQIKYPKFNPGSKYLLISLKNIVYYGQLNQEGFPQTNSGIFIFSDGSYYQGQIKNGKPDGKGKITNLENSYSYTGDWKKGLPHGEGTEIINNNEYKGQFHHGKKNGKGKISYEDGSFYEGDFFNNVIEGQGKLYSKNNYWEGTWKNGYMEGQGRQIISKQEIKNQNDLVTSRSKKDTSQYTGQFVKGEKCGFGNFRWNKNYEYEGKFEKGQLHGEGTFKFKGKVYAGVWSNGTEVKISQTIRGVPSVILSGNIKKDGSIIISNKGLRQNKAATPPSNISSRLESIQEDESLCQKQRKQ